MKQYKKSIQILIFAMLTIGVWDVRAETNTKTKLTYPIVDTNQTAFFDDGTTGDPITSPCQGGAWFGQDAQYQGNGPSYRDHKDGTISDLVTGLMWQKSPDQNGDGKITTADKLTYEQATTGAARLRLGGYSDWRLPTIKELYSLIEFSGRDASGYRGSDTSGLVPFIDTRYFPFVYGDTGSNERLIDSQYASATVYLSPTYVGGKADKTVFGVNFSDGRIKGYGLVLPNGQAKTFLVLYVRGNNDYGRNKFRDQGDGTIIDNATGLVWAKDDSGKESPKGMTWAAALAWAAKKNVDKYLGHNDWRLPNAKELQSIVDYSRSPSGTDSAAIDPLFNATTIINEAGEKDWGFYWTGTTHIGMGAQSSGWAVYISFGKAMGYINDKWVDVHGAGAQRSDPKKGSPKDFQQGMGAQRDAIRINNFVRLVRCGENTIVTGGKPAQTLPGKTISDSNEGQPPGGVARPDFAKVSKTLGIPVDQLEAALLDPATGPVSISVGAQKLGISQETLSKALESAR